MNDQDFATELKQFPCPDCGEVGHLTAGHATVQVTMKGQPIQAEGEVTHCDDCNANFMDDALTESIANQVNKITHGHANEYLEVNRHNGDITTHLIN